jgi:hypothetical protein
MPKRVAPLNAKQLANCTEHPLFNIAERLNGVSPERAEASASG